MTPANDNFSEAMQAGLEAVKNMDETPPDFVQGERKRRGCYLPTRKPRRRVYGLPRAF